MSVFVTRELNRSLECFFAKGAFEVLRRPVGFQMMIVDALAFESEVGKVLLTARLEQKIDKLTSYCTPQKCTRKGEAQSAHFSCVTTDNMSLEIACRKAKITKSVSTVKLPSEILYKLRTSQ